MNISQKSKLLNGNGTHLSVYDIEVPRSKQRAIKTINQKSQNNPFHDTKNITNEVRLIIVMYLKLEL
jgi:hypothetical protein